MRSAQRRCRAYNEALPAPERRSGGRTYTSLRDVVRSPPPGGAARPREEGEGTAFVAIYHLSAKIIARSSGRTVVAAAAYRAGASLHDEASGVTFDYTRKRGVEHTEILAPHNAPDWVFDRSRLWNAVEAAEKRKDAQLAREIEVGLPVELGRDEQVALLKDFIQREFISKGMVAEFAIHRDKAHNPHAHILLTLRRLTPEGFGPKERAWNHVSELMGWRAGWEEATNEHLARAGLGLRIDHRSLKAQEIELTPGRKIGVSLERQVSPAPPTRIAERVAEQREIARENGERIIADPALALRSLTHMQATFTHRDVAKFLHSRTDGADQFADAYLKVTTSPELVPLGTDDRGRTRYTSREMLSLERAMLSRAERMTHRPRHAVAKTRQESVGSQHRLSGEQRDGYASLTSEGDLKALIGVAGSGKSKLLVAAREAWEAEGYTVKGAALSGIAAENLSLASGIDSRTLASLEYAWRADRDRLSSNDVLVIDEAGMVGTRQLARVLEAAEVARAKVVLVGDPEQLQAIEAGAAFRGVLTESGFTELTKVHRQKLPWQGEATQKFATARTPEALRAYESQGCVLQFPTREEARAALLERWAQDGAHRPESSRLMLAYTRADVHALNELARAQRMKLGELGDSEAIETERGSRTFAVGERIYFLRNERSLGVKNGSLGTVEAVRGGMLQVKLDAGDTRIAVDTHFYRDLDYGYAATVYKAQGATIDHAYILASPHYDRHSTYVALSRHRESATLCYAADDFHSPYAAGPVMASHARERFLQVLSRERPKELAHDYLDLHVDSTPLGSQDAHRTSRSLAQSQQEAAEQWRQRQLEQGLSPSVGEDHASRLDSSHSRDAGPDHDLSAD
jgi:Ti-type conjugative transfer relaxase TraA